MFIRSHTWVFAAAVVTIAACDNDSPVDPAPPDDQPVLAPLVVATEWQHPLPQGNDLFRIWGFSSGAFYTVGEAGTVLRYDSGVVTPLNTPTREDLRALWAGGESDILACGDNGTLIHFDGNAWSKVVAPTSADLYAVWGASNDIFITGVGGTVWNRWNGNWSEYVLAADRRFNALWGYSHNEVYVGGSTGSLYRFDGVTWSPVAIFDTPDLDVEVHDLWGPSPGSISLVDRWEILWYNGASWNGIQVVDSRGLGLFGFALNQQIAVGTGTSTHWSNGTRTWYDTSTDEPLFDVWGTSMTNCYAIGKNGALVHFSGSQWSSLNSGSVSDLRDISVEGASGIAVGANGTILRQAGSQWIEEPIAAGYELTAVWQQDGLQVAVGRYAPDGFNWRQAVLLNDGSGWADVGPVGQAHRLFDVWGSFSTDVYAVGWAGEILHFDGVSWGIASPGVGDAAFLNSISGTADGNAIAVGRTDDLRGLVSRYDGSTWSSTKLKDVEELYAVWVEDQSNAFAVGAFGAVRHFDGQFWRKMKSPTRAPLFCVWGTSSRDVYAGGVDGTLIHYDGSTWRELLPATKRSINSISGRSESEIYFAGDNGSILRFDGL